MRWLKVKGNRWDAWLETIEEREVNTTQAKENNSYHKIKQEDRPEWGTRVNLK